MISIHIEKSDLVYTKASEFIINWLRLYHNITQKTLVLLSGGSAVNLYKDITKFIDKSDLDFTFLAFAQIDERFCPEGTKQVKSFPRSGIHDAVVAHKFANNIGTNFKFQKEDINAYQIKKTGLWKICREKNIPYYIFSQAGSLQESAEEYNKTLEKLFKEYTYKIAILGIGEDGHTAGLLPGYQKEWDKDRLIVGYENNGGFKRRISMTSKALKQVDQAIVVASGEKKKGVIKNLLDDNYKSSMDSFPALIIRRIQKSDLFFSAQS